MGRPLVAAATPPWSKWKSFCFCRCAYRVCAFRDLALRALELSSNQQRSEEERIQFADNFVRIGKNEPPVAPTSEDSNSEWDELKFPAEPVQINLNGLSCISCVAWPPYFFSMGAPVIRDTRELLHKEHTHVLQR